jgi:hypothetical protein
MASYWLPAYDVRLEQKRKEMELADISLAIAFQNEVLKYVY